MGQGARRPDRLCVLRTGQQSQPQSSQPDYSKAWEDYYKKQSECFRLFSGRSPSRAPHACGLQSPWLAVTFAACPACIHLGVCLVSSPAAHPSPVSETCGCPLPPPLLDLPFRAPPGLVPAWAVHVRTRG